VHVIIRTIRHELAMVAGAAQAALALSLTLGLHLTAVQTGALEAAAAGLAAAIVAAYTRPVAVPVLTGGLTAILTCLVAFGVPHVTAVAVSGANAALAAVLATLLRVHQTPVAADPPPPPPPDLHACALKHRRAAIFLECGAALFGRAVALVCLGCLVE
jgi:hypothetical protein